MKNGPRGDRDELRDLGEEAPLEPLRELAVQRREHREEQVAAHRGGARRGGLCRLRRRRRARVWRRRLRCVRARAGALRNGGGGKERRGLRDLLADHREDVVVEVRQPRGKVVAVTVVAPQRRDAHLARLRVLQLEVAEAADAEEDVHEWPRRAHRRRGALRARRAQPLNELREDDRLEAVHVAVERLLPLRRARHAGERIERRGERPELARDRRHRVDGRGALALRQRALHFADLLPPSRRLLQALRADRHVVVRSVEHLQLTDLVRDSHIVQHARNYRDFAAQRARLLADVTDLAHCPRHRRRHLRHARLRRDAQVLREELQFHRQVCDVRIRALVPRQPPQRRVHPLLLVKVRVSERGEEVARGASHAQ